MANNQNQNGGPGALGGSSAAKQAVNAANAIQTQTGISYSGNPPGATNQIGAGNTIVQGAGGLQASNPFQWQPNTPGSEFIQSIENTLYKHGLDTNLWDSSYIPGLNRDDFNSRLGLTSHWERNDVLLKDSFKSISFGYDHKMGIKGNKEAIKQLLKNYGITENNFNNSSEFDDLAFQISKTLEFGKSKDRFRRSVNIELLADPLVDNASGLMGQAKAIRVSYGFQKKKGFGKNAVYEDRTREFEINLSNSNKMVRNELGIQNQALTYVGAKGEYRSAAGELLAVGRHAIMAQGSQGIYVRPSEYTADIDSLFENSKYSTVGKIRSRVDKWLAEQERSKSRSKNYGQIKGIRQNLVMAEEELGSEFSYGVARDYFKALDLNSSVSYTSERRTKNAKDIFNRIIGMQQSVAEYSAWAGGEGQSVQLFDSVGSASQARGVYRSTLGAMGGQFHDYYTTRMHMQASYSGDSPYGQGVVKIPGIQHSQGPEFDLLWNPSRMRVMDIEKRRQMLRSETSIVGESLEMYRSGIGYGVFGGKVGQSPFINLRTYTGTEAVMQKAIRAYAKHYGVHDLASIALTEDTALVAKSLFNGSTAVRTTTGAGYDILNVAGVGQRQFGGRNIMEAAIHEATTILQLSQSQASLFTSKIRSTDWSKSSLMESLEGAAVAIRPKLNLGQFSGTIRENITNLMRAQADSGGNLFLGIKPDRPDRGGSALKQVIEGMSGFRFTDVTFGGRSTDSWMKITGVHERGLGEHFSKFLSTLKATTNKAIDDSHIAGISALSNVVQREINAAAGRWSATSMGRAFNPRTDFSITDAMFVEAEALAKTDRYKAIRMISPEGVESGGMAKGLADISLSKEIKTVGYGVSEYKYLDLAKATRVEEELKSMAGVISSMTDRGMAPDDILKLSKDLELFGFKLSRGQNGGFAVEALGGMKEVAETKAILDAKGQLTVAQQAAANVKGYGRMSYEERMYHTAQYVEAQMAQMAKAGNKDFGYYGLHQAQTGLDDFRAKVYAVADMQVGKAPGGVLGSTMDAEFSRRNPLVNKIKDMLIQRESVNVVEAAKSAQQILSKYGYENIYDVSYNVVDEVKNLVETVRTRSEKNQEAYYRIQKGLLTEKQRQLVEQFRLNNMPPNIKEKFKYLYSMIDPTKGSDSDIKLNEIVDFLKLDNIDAHGQGILAKIMREQDSTYDQANKSMADYFNLFKTKYGLNFGVADTLGENRLKMSQFMGDVLLSPNEDLRKEFLNKFFGGRGAINMDVTQTKDDFTQLLFKNFFNRYDPKNPRGPRAQQVGVSIGESEEASREFLAKYGAHFPTEQAGQEGYMALKRISLNPEDYGFKREQYKYGKGGIGSYEEEDVHGKIREMFEDLTTTKYNRETQAFELVNEAKVDGLTGKAEYIYGKQTRTAFGYIHNTIISKQGGNELEKAIGMEYVGFRGRAKASGILESQIDFAKAQGMYDNFSVLVHEEEFIEALKKAHNLEAERIKKEGANQLELDNLKKELDDRITRFQSGFADISQTTRGPLNTSSRQMMSSVYSSKFYGANVEKGQVAVFSATEDTADALRQNEIRKLFLAQKNLDFDGDQLMVRLFMGKELGSSAKTYHEMQRSAGRAVAGFMLEGEMIAQQGTTFSKLYQNVLDVMEKEAPGAEGMRKQIAADTLLRVGMIGGRKAIAKMKGVQSSRVEDDIEMALRSFLGAETGSATNMYNAYSTFLKSNAGLYRKALSDSLGIRVGEEEVFSMIDLVNEQIAEAFANIKNYHAPSELLELHKEMQGTYRSGGFLEGFEGYMRLTRQAFEPLMDPSLGTTTLGQVIHKPMLNFFFSDAEDSVLNQSRTAIKQALGEEGRIIERNMKNGIAGNADEFIRLISGGNVSNALNLIQKMEDKIGDDSKTAKAFAQAVFDPRYQQTLAQAGAEVATKLQESAQQVLQNSQVTESAVATAKNVISNAGGSITNSSVSSSIEDSLIRAIEANKQGIGKTMAIGGAVGIGMMAGAALFSAISSRFTSEDDLESRRNMASKSREEQAMRDEVIHQGPTMINEGHGGFNYNKLSRKSFFGSMRETSSPDIMSGAPNGANINVMNNVTKSTLDSALGLTYGQDSY